MYVYIDVKDVLNYISIIIFLKSFKVLVIYRNMFVKIDVLVININGISKFYSLFLIIEDLLSW